MKTMRSSNGEREPCWQSAGYERVMALLVAEKE